MARTADSRAPRDAACAGRAVMRMGSRLARMRLRHLDALLKRLRQYLHARGILDRVRMHIDHDLPPDSEEGRSRAYSTVCRLIEELERHGEEDLAGYDALLDWFSAWGRQRQARLLVTHGKRQGTAYSQEAT